ncbi:MAG TPA: HNH endonuclease [Candidatus Eisenbacteria bacterium]|nr:HNH endonuclease [Candidatus Eisenbacteria bacterium]
MQSYSLTHVSDAVLLRDLATLMVRDRMTTAEILAHIAEMDTRRLYAPAGYSSMHAYCVGELKLTEDAAFKRIQAARAARQFPELFQAVADGRLHLIGVCLLAPYLNPSNSSELIRGASDKPRLEIEAWLVDRLAPVPMEFGVGEVATSQVGLPSDAHVGSSQVATTQVATSQVSSPEVATSQPLGINRSETLWVRAKLSRTKLRYAQALLSHALPSGEVDQVLDRALDALIHQLEKRKIGITSMPRRARPSAQKRHVPAQVRRTVWDRDGGQCTFVSASGKRCDERRLLEFDHVEPVARGGSATVQNIRLRCRTHNQYEAEREFGTDFIECKRTERPVKSEGRETREVLAGLRNLGCKPGDARRAAEYAGALPVANIEDRMRAALQFLGAKSIRPLPAG